MWYYVLSIFVNYIKYFFKGIQSSNDFLFHTYFDLVLTIYCCYSVIVTLTGLDRENVKADPNTNTNQVVSTISESVSEVSERWSLDI